MHPFFAFCVFQLNKRLRIIIIEDKKNKLKNLVLVNSVSSRLVSSRLVGLVSRHTPNTYIVYCPTYIIIWRWNDAV